MKNSEVAKESCILAYILCTFQFFLDWLKINPTSKMTNKEFLLKVAKDWVRENMKTGLVTDIACPETLMDVAHEDPP